MSSSSSEESPSVLLGEVTPTPADHHHDDEKKASSSSREPSSLLEVVMPMPSPYGSKLIVPVKKGGGSGITIMKKVTETEFKRPLAPPAEPIIRKKKRKVLSEDKFAEALDTIIQRECFPDLEKLKAQNAYLDAVSNNDVHMMRELHMKYGVGRTPTPSLQRTAVVDTPSTFETPTSELTRVVGISSSRDCTPALSLIGDNDKSLESVPPGEDDPAALSDTGTSKSSKGGGGGVSSKEKSPHEMGLNEFLNMYTSEDNRSFQDIIDEGIRKHKIKYAWLYDQEEKHQSRHQLSISLPSMSEQQSLGYQRQAEVETWTYKNKNAVMYIPEGVPYTSEELAELAKKKNAVEFKNTRFTPGTTTPVTTHVGHSEGGTTGPTPPSFVPHPLNIIRGLAEHGKIGVDGKEVSSSSQSPGVAGFKYVRTPSPAPGAQDTPFLTWGEIEGTPFRLDASDTVVSEQPGTPYRMIATSDRERIALELADKVSQRHRDKKQKTIDVAKSYLASPSPRPKSSLERMSSMSPAAQRFAKALLKKSEMGSSPRTPRDFAD